MLADHFKSTVTLSRSTVTGNKTTYDTVGDPFACHIQPITDTYSEGAMGRSQKSFLMFSTSEVRIGDRLLDQDGAKYEVYGAVNYRFRGQTHYEATLRGV